MAFYLDKVIRSGLEGGWKVKYFYLSAIGLVIALGVAYGFVVQDLYDVSEQLEKCREAYARLIGVPYGQ
jgi:hypothetical protein